MTVERLADWLANTNPGFFIIAAALLCRWSRRMCSRARSLLVGGPAAGACRADLMRRWPEHQPVDRELCSGSSLSLYRPDSLSFVFGLGFHHRGGACRRLFAAPARPAAGFDGADLCGLGRGRRVRRRSHQPVHRVGAERDCVGVPGAGGADAGERAGGAALSVLPDHFRPAGAGGRLHVYGVQTGTPVRRICAGLGTGCRSA